MTDLRIVQKPQRDETVKDALFEMEGSLIKAEGFAKLLRHLGACPDNIESDALATLADSLHDAISYVKQEWKTAFEAMTST